MIKNLMRRERFFWGAIKSLSILECNISTVPSVLGCCGLQIANDQESNFRNIDSIREFQFHKVKNLFSPLKVSE